MTYKFKDEVWHRVVQIVQLAMITGTDVTDYLRQIEVVPDDETATLGLSESYEKIFERTLEQLTERIVDLQAQAEGVDLGEKATIVDMQGNETSVQFPSIGILPPLSEDEKKPN